MGILSGWRLAGCGPEGRQPGRVPGLPSASLANRTVHLADFSAVFT